MKKLLLAGIIVASAGSLHSMEQVSPVKLQQIYYYFTDNLTQDVAQQIFMKLFEAQGIDFASLDINKIDNAEAFLTKLLNGCHYDFVVEIAKALLNKKGISICDIKDEDRSTLLHKAVDKLMMTKLLIEIAGDNISTLLLEKTTNYRQDTVLHLAIKQDQVETVRLLLKAAGNDVKALLECCDGFNKTPLSLAEARYKSEVPVSTKWRVDVAIRDKRLAILNLVTGAYATCNKDEDEEEALNEPTNWCVLQ